MKFGDMERRGPGLAADQNKTLEDIRRRIDEIDDAILALIGERMQAVYDVRAAKADLDNGQSTAMRPGREAAILRRLVSARGDAVPAGLVVRLWREVIASATRLQGPLPLHVADMDGVGGVSDLAREHFGTGGEMTRHGSGNEVIDAVALREKDVLGFDVAVDNPFGMRRGERAATLKHDGARALRVDGHLTAEHVGQVLPFEELHDEIARASGGLPEVGDVDDVLVPNARCALRLLPEPGNDLRAA